MSAIEHEIKRLQGEVREIKRQKDQMESAFLDGTARLFATPPIKGKITKGKLKWRGVKMIYQYTSEGIYRSWLEQRGVKIGNTFEFRLIDRDCGGTSEPSR